MHVSDARDNALSVEVTSAPGADAEEAPGLGSLPRGVTLSAPPLLPGLLDRPESEVAVPFSLLSDLALFLFAQVFFWSLVA